MTTIRLFPPHAEIGLTEYRAILGTTVLTGKNAGEAVGAAINLLQEQGGDISTARVYVQKWGGDEFFSEIQIARLKELIARRDAAWHRGSDLPEAERQELELLIATELDASGKRVERWSLSTLK